MYSAFKPDYAIEVFYSYPSSFASFAASRETAFFTQRRKARQEIAKKKRNRTRSRSVFLMRNLGSTNVGILLETPVDQIRSEFCPDIGGHIRFFRLAEVKANGA